MTKKQKQVQQILMKKETVKHNFYILTAFLLIAIALLIYVSNYSYLIKYRGKQKYLIPFQDTNKDLKKYCDNIL